MFNIDAWIVTISLIIVAILGYYLGVDTIQ